MARNQIDILQKIIQMSIKAIKKIFKCTHNKRNANYNHIDTISHLTDWQQYKGVTTHFMVGNHEEICTLIHFR